MEKTAKDPSLSFILIKNLIDTAMIQKEKLYEKVQHPKDAMGISKNTKVTFVCGVCKAQKINESPAIWKKNISPADKTRPVSHGYCPDCYAIELKKIIYLKKSK